jgi:endonuclease I
MRISDHDSMDQNADLEEMKEAREEVEHVTLALFSKG